MQMRILLTIFCVACTQGDPGGDPFDPGNDSGTGGGGSGSGSGGGGTVEGINRSGTRIKMKVMSTPDGAKVLNGWHDAMLAVDCYFWPAADGMTRCLPVTTAYKTSNTYFADAACTISVALGPGCSAPAPKYIIEYPDSQTCNTGRYRVFAVGAKYTTAYVKSGTSCTATSSSPTYAFYALGAEVPATTFQSATSSVE